MSSRTAARLALAAIVLGTLAAWFLSARARDTDPPAALPERVDGDARGAPANAVTPAAIVSAEEHELDPAASEDHPSRESASEVQPKPAARSIPSFGELEIRALDAGTGLPIEGFRVRALSSTRIADRQATAGMPSLRLKLTPGGYAVLVQSRGFEPVELAPQEIAEGALVTPPAVRLQPASARIVGTLRGDRERALQVELLGQGRGPCPSCAQGSDDDPSSPEGREFAWIRTKPCERCGFSKDASRRPLDGSSAFQFENLAAGRYALRLIDGDGATLGIPLALELRAFEARAVELAVPVLRAVEVEVLDTNGVSLASEWAARIRRQRGESDDDEIVPFESGPDAHFDCTVRSADQLIARASLSPPARSSFGGTLVGVGVSYHDVGLVRRTRLVDDRERSAEDALWPTSRAPVIPPRMLTAFVTAEGRAHFQPLSEGPLQLELSCGPFAASASIPPSRELTTVQARLVERGAQVENGARTWLDYEAGSDR